LVSDSLARQRFLLLLFGIFAGLALLLACIGILRSVSVSDRSPCAGNRRTHGARRKRGQCPLAGAAPKPRHDRRWRRCRRCWSAGGGEAVAESGRRNAPG